MDLYTLESFFMWCTIINGAIYLEWVLFFIFAPDLVTYYLFQHVQQTRYPLRYKH